MAGAARGKRAARPCGGSPVGGMAAIRAGRHPEHGPRRGAACRKRLPTRKVLHPHPVPEGPPSPPAALFTAASFRFRFRVPGWLLVPKPRHAWPGGANPKAELAGGSASQKTNFAEDGLPLMAASLTSEVRNDGFCLLLLVAAPWQAAAQGGSAPTGHIARAAQGAVGRRSSGGGNVSTFYNGPPAADFPAFHCFRQFGFPRQPEFLKSVTRTAGESYPQWSEPGGRPPPRLSAARPGCRAFSK